MAVQAEPLLIMTFSDLICTLAADGRGLSDSGEDLSWSNAQEKGFHTGRSMLRLDNNQQVIGSQRGNYRKVH